MSALPESLASLQAQGVLPRTLSARQQELLARALAHYSDELSADQLKKILAQVKAGLEDVLNPRQVLREGATQTVTEGATQNSLRSQLTVIADSLGAQELSSGLEFMLDVSRRVTQGAGAFIQQNADPQVVNLYPGLALSRRFERDVPRGFRRGKDGALIPVPDDDWPSRWEAASAETEDDDWLPWEGDDQSGRGVALKSSGIWQALGDGAGGYTDTLGNPFPPFAFNSGFDTRDVSRAECEDLGLLDKGQRVQPHALDFTQLLGMKEAA